MNLRFINTYGNQLHITNRAFSRLIVCIYTFTDHRALEFSFLLVFANVLIIYPSFAGRIPCKTS